MGARMLSCSSRSIMLRLGATCVGLGPLRPPTARPGATDIRPVTVNLRTKARAASARARDSAPACGERPAWRQGSLHTEMHRPLPTAQTCRASMRSCQMRWRGLPPAAIEPRPGPGSDSAVVAGKWLRPQAPHCRPAIPHYLRHMPRAVGPKTLITGNICIHAGPRRRTRRSGARRPSSTWTGPLQLAPPRAPAERTVFFRPARRAPAGGRRLHPVLLQRLFKSGQPRQRCGRGSAPALTGPPRAVGVKSTQ